MHIRLLVIALLLVAPWSVHAQVSRVNTAADFVPSSSPRVVAPSSVLSNGSFSVPRAARQAPLVPALDFTRLTRSSGMIFSGTVVSITATSASGDAVAAIAITFHVDQGLRGVDNGQTITIRQWMGLWSSGQRFRVGERALLFLYPPSKLGLTSPVAGTLGRFRIDSLGRVVLSAEHLAAFRYDPILGMKFLGARSLGPESSQTAPPGASFSKTASRISLSDFVWAVRRASGEE